MGVKTSKLGGLRTMKRLTCPNSVMTPKGYIPVAVGISDEKVKRFVVPKGYIPVAVGTSDEKVKRFVVHTRALCNAEFKEFLGKSAEEYEFQNEGILRIPYDAKAFEEWLTRNSKCKGFRVQPMPALAIY